MREALFLVGKGVPFDVAFSLETPDRMAFCIAIAESESSTHHYDWENDEWVDAKEAAQAAADVAIAERAEAEQADMEGRAHAQADRLGRAGGGPGARGVPHGSPAQDA